ncbi:hypothetical protein, partial [Endozoicomonas atrinae]|uniref:hypothetical protein n=1 Tax=Endozoicomonas atrinae TaxID=1333660 RepID=UPI001586525D
IILSFNLTGYLIYQFFVDFNAHCYSPFWSINDKRLHNLNYIPPYCCSRLQEKLEDLMFDCKTDIDLGLYKYENCPIQKMRESEALKEQIELAQAYFRENVPPAG